MTDDELVEGAKESPITSPGNSWNLLGRENVLRLDHSPSCLASTSKAYTWFEDVDTISTLLFLGVNPPAVTEEPFNLDINQCCLLHNEIQSVPHTGNTRWRSPHKHIELTWKLKLSSGKWEFYSMDKRATQEIMYYILSMRKNMTEEFWPYKKCLLVI